MRPNRTKHTVDLRLTQAEAELIHAVFSDLYSTEYRRPERLMVSDIYDALADFEVDGSPRGYRLELSNGGLSSDRCEF
jgi:hypothetical protein